MAITPPQAPGETGTLRPAPVSSAPPVPSNGTFASLEQRLTTYICYAQVFGSALTLDDLVTRAGPGEARQVRSALADLVRSGRLSEEGGFYLLPGRSLGDFHHRREERRQLAERILAENQRLLRILERLPFVRVVAVSGSVAAGNAVPDGKSPPDCDLFIITADGTLNIVRLALRFIMKVGELVPSVGLTSRRYRPCANFMVEESASAIENPSLYTATEAVQVRVLKGEAEYAAFVSHNAWVGRYYTGGLAQRSRANGRPALRRSWGRAVTAVLNLACFAFLGGASWVKSRIHGTRFSYSFRLDLGKEKSLRRSRPVGGGYQVTVRNRFAGLYRAHFGHLCSEEYLEFLFPGTSEAGITLNGRLFTPSPLLTLSDYDGLLSTGR